ncbi:MAG: Uma2 family endonuclease [Armatimonadetes bacterium]|nr:Uma2 family endonuclease [Armatimonadota bacterium]MDW8029278.1 Uma2 family endonuclease [Armatimonadota bacterium]
MELKQTEQIVATKQKMTWQEFLAWIDEDIWAEWVKGEVLIMSPASNLHQALVLFLAALMQHWAEAYDLGVVRTEPFLVKLPEPLPARAPDIIFIAKENLHKITTNYLDGAPDIVVEIISPESRARDRGEKFYEYEQGGVKEYWLIDPNRKQAEFYRLGEDGVFRLVSVIEEGIFRSEVLKGFWLKVDWLWQEPLPSLMSVLKVWELA